MQNIEEYFNSFSNETKNPSLKAMQYFMNEYNNFEKEMKFIHIAGTNGKGSCTEMLTNILIHAGYKVGKFISPHLIKYNERTSINNINISDEELNQLIEELQPKVTKYNSQNTTKVTLFELETTLALLYFYRNNVDFVVLETGLGGLYDCTNIISNPLICLITSIGYDHMAILGNTLEEIAIQKAGIIKPHSHTVIFEDAKEVNSVFINTCKEKNSTLHLLKQNDINNFSYDNKYLYFDYKNLKNLKVNLKGKKQVQNASLCIECVSILQSLGYNIKEENLRIGISTVVHKARFETIYNNPLIIFDGAHNEPAILNLQNSINMYYKNTKRCYIVSILAKKDYKKIIPLLMQDKDAMFIFTSGNDENRFAKANDLYDIAKLYGSNIYTKDLNEAIDFVLKNNHNFVNFVIGSFYVYADVINLLVEGKNDRIKKY